MANQPGIGYDSMILNKKEEKVVEEMSRIIMEYGQPTHGDMMNDPVFPATSVFQFAGFWDGVFPEIAGKIAYKKQYAFTPMWGCMTSLSALYGGISFMKTKLGGSDFPKEVQEALDAFEALLVNEANEIGNGTQSFVAERYEHLQK